MWVLISIVVVSALIYDYIDTRKYHKYLYFKSLDPFRKVVFLSKLSKKDKAYFLNREKQDET